MYFKISKLRSWGKRSAVHRRRFIQRFLKGRSIPIGNFTNFLLISRYLKSLVEVSKPKNRCSSKTFSRSRMNRVSPVSFMKLSWLVRYRMGVCTPVGGRLRRTRPLNSAAAQNCVCPLDSLAKTWEAVSPCSQTGNLLAGTGVRLRQSDNTINKNSTLPTAEFNGLLMSIPETVNGLS